MVIDVLRLDDYFKRKKKRSSMKFHCYYWRYGQVGMPELCRFRQTGENNDLNTLINNWADHPGRGPQALHPDGGVLGEEVPRILLRQRLHPQRQRQQGVENDFGVVNPTS